MFNRDEEANALGLPAVGATEGALAAAAPLALSCWRGRASLNILVAKPECTQLAEKLRFAAKRKVRQCLLWQNRQFRAMNVMPVNAAD